jgi:hypothetical protein
VTSGEELGFTQGTPMSTKTDPWLSYEHVLADLDVARNTLDDSRRSGRGPVLKRLPNSQLRIRSSAYDAWEQFLEDARDGPAPEDHRRPRHLRAP